MTLRLLASLVATSFMCASCSRRAASPVTSRLDDAIKVDVAALKADGIAVVDKEYLVIHIPTIGTRGAMEVFRTTMFSAGHRTDEQLRTGNLTFLRVEEDGTAVMSLTKDRVREVRAKPGQFLHSGELKFGLFEIVATDPARQIADVRYPIWTSQPQE